MTPKTVTELGIFIKPSKSNHLDGGRLVFLLIELIFRRPVPQKYEAYIHAAGMLLLFGLMIVVTFNDIIRLF